MPADVERMGDFGARLQRQREQQGLSVREIAARIKVSARTLDALERNDVSRLPAGIFARAIVRAYAGEIGLEPESVVRDFLRHFPQDRALDPPAANRPDLAPARTRAPMRIAFFLTVIIPVIVGVLLLLSQL